MKFVYKFRIHINCQNDIIIIIISENVVKDADANE